MSERLVSLSDKTTGSDQNAESEKNAVSDKNVAILQANAEQQLAAAIYQLGTALSDPDASETISQLRQIQLAQLANLLSTPKWQLLAESFSLSGDALSLLAIVYLFQLEPDLLSVYAGLGWYERGPGISAERALWLTLGNSDTSVSKHVGLQLVLQHSGLIHSGLLIGRDPENPLHQPLAVSDPFFRFMTAGYANTQVISYVASGWLSPARDVVNVATSAVFNDQITTPSTGLNTVEGVQDDESLAFITSLLAAMASRGQPERQLWLVHPLQDEPHAAAAIQAALLAVRLETLPAKQALYWPTLWQDCSGAASMRAMAERLIISPDIVLFCNHASPEGEQDQPLWVKGMYKHVVQRYQLDASTAHMAAGWLALSEDAEGTIPLSEQETRLLAEQYPLSTREMARIFRTVLSAGAPTFSALQRACLEAMTTHNDGLATFYLPRITLADMVLTVPSEEQLCEVLARVRYRRALEPHTGGALSGTQALFWGPPGTGKTMAAEAIAGELGLPIYKVNLANVASKWIGETEKHLANLFDRAEKQKAVLLFDEADAIFAKRSEVESSHDKNANMGVSFLLQRMETYQGVLLLSTNFKANIDDAFLRRFTAVIEFTLPDKALRETLWQHVWKGDLQPDNHVNVAYLAAEFELSPSQIRNVAERACLYALMENRGAISQPLLAKALRRELDKQSAGFLASQMFADWATA